jgi:3-methylcrotonyl-CoA carboxylase alpha subunit
VEFLVHERAFYFIEMNTRLQVEHPVTEMVTGYDLVEWQLRVAAGQAIPVTQDEIRIRGHAVEARLYAEDPERDFLPASGRLTLYRLPAPGPDLRVETGVAEGDVIPVFYDALLAKLIGWGEDREAALRRLDAALAATRLAGIANNRDVLLRLVRHPSIISGGVGTGFIGQERAALLPASAPAPFAVLAAASLFVLHEEAAGAARTAAASDDPYSPWQTRDGWRLFEPSEYALRWMDAGVERHLQVGLLNGGYRMTLDGAGSDARLISVSGSALTFEFNSVRRTVAVVRDRDEFTVITEADSWKLRRADPSARPGDVEESLGRLTAPMHGTVLDVAVVPGSNVRRGERLMLLECMKLEYAIVAPADAVVETVHCAAGDIVEEGATLLVLSSSQPG